MATTGETSFHITLQPEGQQITGLRFYYGDVSSSNNDDVALNFLSLSSATQPRQELSLSVCRS